MPEPETFNQTCQNYVDHLYKLGKKRSTVKIYDHCLNFAVDFFGKEKLTNSITVLNTGKFYVSDIVNKNPKTEKPRSAITIKQIKRVFRQCMDYALEQKLIETLPIPKSELDHSRKKKKPDEGKSKE